MGTYFHGNSSSEAEPSAEGLQTLYLMNPNYVPYSHASQNTLLANPNATSHSHALHLASFSHAPLSLNQNHLVGVAIPASNIIGSSTADTHTQRFEVPAFHGFPAAAGANANAAPRVNYNLWNSNSIEDQAAQESNSSECAVTVAAVTANSAADYPIGFHRPIYQRGLSLSLSSPQQTSYRSLDVERGVSPGSYHGDDVRVPCGGVSNVHGVVSGSKYLKAAQELLDEVVNVGKGIYKRESVEGTNNRDKRKVIIESSSGFDGDGSSGGGAELSTAQRQELQMKKSKLVTMLDEVEVRYRQYHNQMRTVISSFEQGAGFGTAKSYTSLALKTISKQFRSLKDAISSQIRIASKSLGEDDCLGAKAEGSRLRYVDKHLRQQRALQQLGMIQHNAWRPQRGLPERAVSILRAWLFEHFLHPYPKDSDKVMLARQTGLTRSQVSNWFINARVRLWKPMVEEMYTEEIKGKAQNNATQESAATRLDHIDVLHSKPERLNNQNNSPTEISNSNNISVSTSLMRGGSFQSHSTLHLAGSSDIQRSPKTSPGSILSVDIETTLQETKEPNTKYEVERHSKDGYPLMTGNENHGGAYGVFSMEDIRRFNVTEQLAPRFHGNGVSLTLGLPHSENLPLSATQHGFLSQNIHLEGRLEMGTNEAEFCSINTATPPSSHAANSYNETIDFQNRKRLSAQLLRNFVS